MNEKKDKSLQEQINKAELEKIKAETVKAEIEGAEVKRRIKQYRLMGVPIVQIIFGGIVVGFILLSYIQPILDFDTDLASKKSEYDKIVGWIERIRLDSTNIALTKEKLRLDSVNRSLDEKTDKAQREVTILLERRLSSH